MSWGSSFTPASSAAGFCVIALIMGERAARSSEPAVPLDELPPTPGMRRMIASTNPPKGRAALPSSAQTRPSSKSARLRSWEASAGMAAVRLTSRVAMEAQSSPCKRWWVGGRGWVRGLG